MFPSGALILRVPLSPKDTTGAPVFLLNDDSKTLANEGKSFTDYTQFLKEDGLKGKRIGWYTSARGTHFKVDTLMQQAVNFIRSQGAEVVEIERIYSGEAEALSFEVMLYEFKDGLNKYFASLGEGAPIKSLEELIAFNISDTVELKYYNQQLLIEAQKKGGIDSKEYLDAVAKMKNLTGREGIDRVMDENRLDAFIAPTGSPAWKTDLVNGDAYTVSSSSPAARSCAFKPLICAFQIRSSICTSGSPLRTNSPSLKWIANTVPATGVFISTDSAGSRLAVTVRRFSK